MNQNSTNDPLQKEPQVPPPPTQPPQPKLTYKPEHNPAATVAGVIILTALGAIIGLIARNNPFMACNDASRWNTIYALVHYHSYKVDLGPWAKNLNDYPFYPDGPWTNIDRIRKDGHFYSSKPPLLPTMMAGPYYVIHKLTGWKLWYAESEKRDADGNPVKWNRWAGRIILLLFNVLPFAVFLALYYRLLNQFDVAPHAQAYCLAVAAGGTFLTAYCTTLTNHLPAAFCAFFSVYCIIQIWLRDRHAWYMYAGAGLFAAFAAAFDLLAALFGIVSFLLVVFRNPAKTFKFYVPAAVLPIAAFFVTNYLAIHDWKPAYAYFGTELYEYEGSYWIPANRIGIDALEQPKGIYLANMLVGNHGIFSLTPVFLFSLFGLFIPFRGKMKPLRKIQLAIALITIAVIAWYCTQTSNYGGMAHGLRRTFWLIPFWLLVMPQIIERAWNYAVLRGFAWLCLALSVFCVGFSAKHPWGMSWVHKLMNYTGLINY